MKEAEGLTPGEYEKMAAGLYEKAGEFFKRNRFQKASVDYAFDLRYRGQSFELPVLFDTRDCTAAGGEMKLPPIPCPDMPSIVEEFHRIHESRYGFCRREEPVEAVNVRINVRGETPAPPFAKRELAGEDPAAAFIGCRRVLLPSGTAVEAGAYVREKLAPGNRIAAPAVIVQYDTVILVPPGWNVRVDEFENILMEKCHVPVH
jgi:N-methylhydantoinase A/oxoprolinase/acetone carboxylase beta subunit